MSALGNLLRSVGRTIDKTGISIQGKLAYIERLVPNTTSITVKKASPATAQAAFIAPNSNIAGNTTVGDSASVWFNATVRGDRGPVTIGEGSSIGDRSTVSDSTIGSGVTVGPNVSINGAKVGDNVLIGANTLVGSGVKIGARSIVEPGSVLPEGTAVPAGQVFAGNPAVSVRAVTDTEVQAIQELTAAGIEKAQAYAFEADKSFGDLLDDEAEKLWQQNFASDHWRDAEYGRVESRQGNVYNRRAASQ
eukprot:CAMPEP_0195521222 /NCGR_PEP_ID=MMETSP0794_2-20130614/18249_1 /TAXON_ID=515487 /ORGANISM="Stephanopyxis turris, Strain CCMP 815" /LENGTH=248 /DNA_ID=CAMNT_0040650731 /DNA_START=69 /DNA_END=815 /DNA_ORIENTATION=-